MTNLYLKRLVRKGYVKCVNVRPNRIRYLITPTGLAEKTRLTYEFIEYSMSLYKTVRQQLRHALEPLVGSERKRVAIYGSGEAAELAYISILECGLELVAVFDDEAKGAFLGRPVLAVREHRSVPFDALIVAKLDSPQPVSERLLGLGVPQERLVPLRDGIRVGAATNGGPIRKAVA